MRDSLRVIPKNRVAPNAPRKRVQKLARCRTPYRKAKHKTKKKKFQKRGLAPTRTPLSRGWW